MDKNERDALFADLGALDIPETVAALPAFFRTLDFSNANAAVAALQAEISEASAAIDRAQTRLQEIGRLLASRNEIDGEAVGDALLRGDEASDAADRGPDAAALRAEREALRAGIADLNRRIDAARLEISAIRDRAQRLAAAFTQPLADKISADMLDAAHRLAAGYAAAYALTEVTRGHGLLLSAARQAVEGLFGPDKLLPGCNGVLLLGDVLDILDELKGKGEALPVRRVPVSAPVP